jgi:hypothetical protein
MYRNTVFPENRLGDGIDDFVEHVLVFAEIFLGLFPFGDIMDKADEMLALGPELDTDVNIDQ